MRLRNYLIERYVNSVRGMGGHDAPVFVNPPRKEQQEVFNKYGFRFIADMKNKKVFMWGEGGAIHGDVMDDGKTFTPFSYSQFVTKGIGADQFFAGLQNLDGTIESDIYDSHLWRINSRVGNYQEVSDNIKQIQTYDTSWLNKYGINGSNVDKYIHGKKQ